MGNAETVPLKYQIDKLHQKVYSYTKCVDIDIAEDTYFNICLFGEHRP